MISLLSPLAMTSLIITRNEPLPKSRNLFTECYYVEELPQTLTTTLSVVGPSLRNVSLCSASLSRAVIVI